MQTDPYYSLDKHRPVEGVLMGFDFGTKRIGVAVGQSLTKTATPLQPLSAQDGIPNWDELLKLVAKWQPEAIVVGIPLNMDDTMQPITKLAMKFGRRLQNRLKLPVFGIDERLTSFEARQKLYEIGGSRLIKKHSIDSIAAQLILESWLKTYCGES